MGSTESRPICGGTRRVLCAFSIAAALFVGQQHLKSNEIAFAGRIAATGGWGRRITEALVTCESAKEGDPCNKTFFESKNECNYLVCKNVGSQDVKGKPEPVYMWMKKI